VAITHIKDGKKLLKYAGNDNTGSSLLKEARKIEEVEILHKITPTSIFEAKTMIEANNQLFLPMSMKLDRPALLTEIERLRVEYSDYPEFNSNTHFDFVILNSRLNKILSTDLYAPQKL
jgi:hypothetical protein